MNPKRMGKERLTRYICKDTLKRKPRHGDKTWGSWSARGAASSADLQASLDKEFS